MAASINRQGTATTVGRAVPVAFALAFVGVLLVAHTFVRLTQRFHHSGSVFWPLPTGVAWWGPVVAIAWFAIGILWVLARPAATRQTGEMLMRLPKGR